jgi:hypothetical protein
MRTVVRLAVLFVVVAAGAARADHSPTRWGLAQVVHGNIGTVNDWYQIDEVVAEDTSGHLVFTVCCSGESLTTCSNELVYQIGWTVDVDGLDVVAGQDVPFTLTNERLSGGACEDIDPFVQAGVPGGFPAPVLDAQGVQTGPGELFDTASAGGRFYTNPEEGFHDPSPRFVSVKEGEGLPHDGYWHIDTTHRWGLQYEVVFVYDVAAVHLDDGGEGEGEGGAALCACARPRCDAPGAAFVALITAVVVGRRRRVR